MSVNNLAGSSPAATYDQLLHIGTSTLGAGGNVYTGDGQKTCLQITGGSNVANGIIQVQPFALELGFTRTGDGPSYIDFNSSNGTINQDYDFRIIRDGSANGNIWYANLGSASQVFLQNGTVMFVIEASGTVRPGANGTQSLGVAYFRWGQIFAATPTISTSDARQKQQIRPLSEAETAVAISLKPLLRAFKMNDAVELKGDKARIHIGIIAQDVVAAFAAEGLDAADYALLCYDEWEAKPETIDKDGKVMEPALAAGNAYGIRYEQLLAFMLAAL